MKSEMKMEYKKLEHKNLDAFDNICKQEVINFLDKLESKCLKEREMAWHKIVGFAIAHINWFEEIKESKIRWDIIGYKIK